MKCYSEKTGPTYQLCDASYGFQSCFTKYYDGKIPSAKTKKTKKIISDEEIILRGCSSRRKMFKTHCESHLSGSRNEQLCYCSFDLCNGAHRDVLQSQFLVKMILAFLLLRIL